MDRIGFLIPILALLIPIVAILIVPLRRWLNVKERKVEAMGRAAAGTAAQHAAHDERLEQRVRVLERIVTTRASTSPTRSSGWATAR